MIPNKNIQSITGYGVGTRSNSWALSRDKGSDRAGVYGVFKHRLRVGVGSPGSNGSRCAFN